MICHDSLYARLDAMGQSQWSAQLRDVLPEKLSATSHGRIPGWLAALQALPELTPSCVELGTQVEIGRREDLAGSTEHELVTRLQEFHPWRKGPFRLFGVEIETEWRSDWKWDRVLPHIQPLAGKKVLDVGCGNGYHGWRMLGAGADFVLGIDPTMVSVMQFHVIRRYIGECNHFLLPLGVEELPAGLNCFDSVFSMGVLYHRRSPLDHLLELRDCLRSGGELVLETLIVDGDEGAVFMPEGRYAKMRNVWFLPSAPTMLQWLRRCGFKDVACVDVNRTSTAEQHRTAWMRYESLADFLDPQDPIKTIEGHPAPLRAIFLAHKP